MDPSFPTIFAVGGYTKSFYRPAFDITPTSLGSLSRRIWGTETNPYYGSYEIPCHPETRIEEIQDVLRWIRAPPSVGEPRHMPMLWIHGSSGVGKSVIAQAIFTECVGKELVSSFFFSSARPTSNTSTHLVRKLLYDLVKARPELRQRVVRVLDNNPSIWESALEQQFETLIVDVLQSTTSFVQRLSRFWRKKPDLVVIDGLDEATEAGRLLDMILSSLNERRLPLRFIVFSTTNSSLAGLLDAHPLRYLPFRIAVDPKNTDQDIRTYLSSCFSKIRSRSLDPELFPVLWPSYEEFEMVILNAESRFLYASVIVEIVRDKVQTTSRYPPFLLTDILNETRANSGDRSPLDSLFQYIIACRGPPEEVATMLGSIFLFRFTSGAASPLFMEHIWDLSSDFSRNPRYFEAQLGALSYLVDYTGNTSADVHFIHASVIDFLREPARAGPVFINELQTYHTLVDRWLKKLAQWQTDTGLELDYRPIEVLWEQWATFITRDWEPDDTVISLLLALDLSLLFNHALSALLTGFRPFHSLFHNLKVVADWLEGCEIPDAQRLRRRFMNAQQTFHVQATIPPTVGDNLLSWISGPPRRASLSSQSGKIAPAPPPQQITQIYFIFE
ncbi:hypothetical protein PQX77_001656 [Marasmius sp. AFHP31]|nr:hypothetical protein PQX77_001656 [Marasmius sp. AFHP31]